MRKVTRTQRWREKIALYRPADEGDFDPDRYSVDAITKGDAERFVTTHHYSRFFPQTRLRYGLFDDTLRGGPELVGVISFGNGSHPNALLNPFPNLEPYYESTELNRMVLRESVPANGESWFASRVFRLAAREGVRGVVAFSDPSEFWQADRNGRPFRTKRGHYGIAYQSLNMDYLGQTRESWKEYFPDGTEWNGRSISKVANGERGSKGVIARLVECGAPPLTDNDNLNEWLALAKKACGITRRRHEGNFKYAVRIGTRSQRSRTTIGVASHGYPKPQSALPGLDGGVL